MTGKLLALLRPADALNIFFLMLLTIIVAASNGKVGPAPQLILLYSGLILLQALLILFKDRGRFMHWVYQLIFPTISILAIFDSLGYIVHSINPDDIDPLLIELDLLLFGGHPTVMLEGIMHPLLTDALQIAYMSYYFMPFILAVALLSQKRQEQFDYALFMIMLCFYLSYAGYMLFPAVGPRFTLTHLQTSELLGYALTAPLQDFLNRLEGIKRDAFPSGHTGIALVLMALSYRFEKRLFRLFLPFTSALIFSTVYLRYHYVVDVFAGVILAVLTLFLGGAYYGYRQKRVRPDH